MQFLVAVAFGFPSASHLGDPQSTAPGEAPKFPIASRSGHFGSPRPRKKKKGRATPFPPSAGEVSARSTSEAWLQSRSLPWLIRSFAFAPRHQEPLTHPGSPSPPARALRAARCIRTRLRRSGCRVDLGSDSPCPALGDPRPVSPARLREFPTALAVRTFFEAHPPLPCSFRLSASRKTASPQDLGTKSVFLAGLPWPAPCANLFSRVLVVRFFEILFGALGRAPGPGRAFPRLAAREHFNRARARCEVRGPGGPPPTPHWTCSVGAFPGMRPWRGASFN